MIYNKCCEEEMWLNQIKFLRDCDQETKVEVSIKRIIKCQVEELSEIGKFNNLVYPRILTVKLSLHTPEVVSNPLGFASVNAKDATVRWTSITQLLEIGC